MSPYLKLAAAGLATHKGYHFWGYDQGPPSISNNDLTWVADSNHGSWETWSKLGTPHAPWLPNWLTDNPLPQGRPWGGRTSDNTNYYQENPNTGKTRYYDWTLTKGACAPDGVSTTCLFVNNEFPGPTIEANWGDWIEVKVTNQIPGEGTSIHWHGLLQKETPWMDGVPGFTQCPIAPGSTFTYRFKADLYGTSWYHSHYSSQYGSGLFGPMVIYGPQNAQYDVDLGPIMINDWYHGYYEDVVASLLKPIPNFVIPASDNNLINGKNSFNCSSSQAACTPNAPLASFKFESGKTYRLRLINPSSAAVEKFSIDGHSFTVIANDFVEVVPYTTDVITLGVGQRSDVLVKATGNPGSSYWARAFKPPPCWPTKGGDEAKAAVFYENADVSQAPTSAPGPNAYNVDCGNDDLTRTVPTYPLAASTSPDVTEILPLVFRPNASNNLLWYMADRTFRTDYNDPMLLDAKLGQRSWPEDRNLHNYGSNTTLRFVLENAGIQPHPMHLHGHNIQILAEGACNAGPSANQTIPGGAGGPPPGVGGGPPSRRDSGLRVSRADGAGAKGNCWDGHITRAENPQRRDVQMLPAGRYLVIQWTQDNPGVWPLHCHIAWHLSAGMVWTVLEQPDKLARDMDIPSVMAQTCRDWAAYTGGTVVEQIDSGL